MSPSTAKSNPSYVDHDASKQDTSASPAPITQIQMDRFIESELHNAIFHDPKFIDRFLSGDTAKLDQVHQKCRKLDSHYKKRGKWLLPKSIQAENSLYGPVLNILNTIKEAVDSINPPSPSPSSSHKPANADSTNPLTSDDDPSEDFIPDQPEFIDTSAYTIRSDRAETKLIKPDLALFEEVEEKYRHWEHLRMPIEIKKLAGYHKAAMKQLSRYARAVFAHQLHRRHLYAMMVCNTEATFVRFDRAGIIYSRRINMRTESKAFTYAFASLLMLDRTDQGYDPAFTCEMNKDGRLDYYVDLPASAFAIHKSSTESVDSEETRTYRFRVVGRLCHRRSICGRATIVIRIRKVKDGDGGNEYILKITWRDPERGVEGEMLRKVKGKFGLAQHVWHRDAFGKCCCSPIVDGQWACTKCVAETVQVDELEVCDALTDVAIEVPPEDEDEYREPELKTVDTTVCHPTSRRRPYRICVFLVISSIGAPLDQAKSPRQFMQAVLDAILGYWGLFNTGILHRDISEGNVLMLTPGRQLDPEDNDPDDTEITDEDLIASEKQLRGVLARLGREPTGMLSDLDLCSAHTLPGRRNPPSGLSPTQKSPRKGNRVVSMPPRAPYTLLSPRSSGYARPREEDTSLDLRQFKKRKTSYPSGAPTATRVGPTGGQDTRNRLIDFRTGTPAFMSIRVIEVPAGQRYHHSFMDDIESFFWLILWSAAAHLDEGAPYPTLAAQSMLNLLNEQNSQAMAGQKIAQLAKCDRTGNAMRKTLNRFGNSWASDPLFTDVILKFGKLAHQYYLDMEDEKDFSPTEVFPAVVEVIQNALSFHSEIL
ncbi:CRISPR-associated endonuclease Cas9 [Streptococcus mutans UA159] [Rhizoctonia solani]|uniref:CRISPR-associated endonuclease Cas9 [Streptococcus mutans UA159] n=1 Tax=Rhizoctonia solani TaxID=456999 RepID=A0A0K6G3M6_9AGAM|nr:unnamed protein product [Rhizoctonia solani]CUA72958.1 CRISPR-associated endonuclease Cas9 [Streptococcus mutans UA159] [Rhizoctonia solani]